VTHRGPYKDGPGEINVPVSISGDVVHPGDIVVGDDDGVLFISPDECRRGRRGLASQDHRRRPRPWTPSPMARTTIAWIDADPARQKGVPL
jgi:hypothetical protein